MQNFEKMKEFWQLSCKNFRSPANSSHEDAMIVKIWSQIAMSALRYLRRRLALLWANGREGALLYSIDFQCPCIWPWLSNYGYYFKIIETILYNLYCMHLYTQSIILTTCRMSGFFLPMLFYLGSAVSAAPPVLPQIRLPALIPLFQGCMA